MSGRNSLKLQLDKSPKTSPRAPTNITTSTDAASDKSPKASPRGLTTRDLIAAGRTKTKASSRNATPGSSWVTYKSPLWRKDRVKSEMELSHSMPTTPRVLSRMETGFINDAVLTKILSNRRKPIIPPYDAHSDKYAQAYFKSPFVQGIMERNKTVVNLKELKNSKTVNKLSVRRRCKNTPNVEQIKKREEGFVNDAIITEKKRTKYKDIIPPYHADEDKLCRDYFDREDIKRLVEATCTPRVVLKPIRKGLTA